MERVWHSALDIDRDGVVQAKHEIRRENAKADHEPAKSSDGAFLGFQNLPLGVIVVGILLGGIGLSILDGIF